MKEGTFLNMLVHIADITTALINEQLSFRDIKSTDLEIKRSQKGENRIIDYCLDDVVILKVIDTTKNVYFMPRKNENNQCKIQVSQTLCTPNEWNF